MTKQPQIALPTDMYRPTQDAGVEYSSLESTSAEARFKKMDLTYSVYLEELENGKQGVQERVARRLNLDTGAKSSRVAIGDSIRVFEAFRLTGEQGLGYSREALVAVPFSRLRAVAQNKDWALKHRDDVDHVLTLPEEGEHGILSYIKSTLSPEELAKMEARSKKKKTNDDGFVSRELRFTTEDAAAFDELMEAVRRKANLQGVEFSDKNEGTALGQLSTFLLLDWIYHEQPLYQDNGKPVLDNAGFLITERNIDKYADDASDAGEGDVAQQAAD